MKTILSTLTLMMSCCLLFAQSYTKVTYESRMTKEVDITKIEMTNQYTIVHFKCVAPASYIYGGWACASPDMYVQDIKTGKKYYLKKTKNIPLCPDKLPFSKPGEVIHFKLYFPKLHHSVRYINIVEHATNGFTFYKVLLTPMA